MQYRWKSLLALAVLIGAPLLGACSKRTPLARLTLSAPISDDGSTLCDGLIDRFIGLPEAHATADSPDTPLLAGRWWIRSCSAQAVSGELRVRLSGPGWYWLDEQRKGFAVQQQVPFTLSLAFDGRARGRTTPGLFALWLEPVRAPKVELKPAAKLDVQGTNAWGALVSAVLPVKGMATERFSHDAASALRDGLQGGVTLTYEIKKGQSDATLGKLAQAETPRHPFDDGSAWQVNEHLLLAPGSTHVVGPFEPGASSLDVSIESGSGLTYQAVCADHMVDQYGAIAGGRVGAIAEQSLGARGNVAGVGLHETTLQVERCKYYLVLSALARKRTLAAVRVRS